MKLPRIIAIATVLLASCMTPVDYSKPRPLKEGEVRVANNPAFENVSSREFEVLEGPTQVTRGMG